VLLDNNVVAMDGALRRPRPNAESGATGRLAGIGARGADSAERALLGPDDVDRDLHRPNRSSVLKPVFGVSILGPTHSRPVVRGSAVSVVSDRSLQYVDDAGSVPKESCRSSARTPEDARRSVRWQRTAIGKLSIVDQGQKAAGMLPSPCHISDTW
jgi:hypothetical protein